MKENRMLYHVCIDDAATPHMYGIQSIDGMCIRRISTDFQEVNRLAECCNSAEVSTVHLADVVEDFRRS